MKSGVTALSSTSNAFGNVATNGRFDTPPNGIDESLKLQILAEEEAAMNQFKVRLPILKQNTPKFYSSWLTIMISFSVQVVSNHRQQPIS